MVNVGDRIRLSSTRGPERDGVVTAVSGSLLRVRWPSDEETTVARAPGTLTVLAATAAVTASTPTKKAARKKSASTTKTTSGKKPTPDNTRSPARAANDHHPDQRLPRRSAQREELHRRDARSATAGRCGARTGQRPMTRRRNPHRWRPTAVRESRSI